MHTKSSVSDATPRNHKYIGEGAKSAEICVHIKIRVNESSTIIDKKPAKYQAMQEFLIGSMSIGPGMENSVAAKQ